MNKQSSKTRAEDLAELMTENKKLKRELEILRVEKEMLELEVYALEAEIGEARYK